MLQRLDPTVRGIILLALLVLVESIQSVIILGYLSNYVPFGADPFNADLFAKYKDQVHPQWQILIYPVFIMVSTIAMALCVYTFRPRLANQGFQKDIHRLIIADGLWVFIQCFGIFKILAQGHPAWAWVIFYASLAASMLSRIFWVELVRGWSKYLSSPNVLVGDPVHAYLDSRQKHSGMTVWTPLFIMAESIQVLIAFNFLFGHTKAGGVFLPYGIFIASIGLLSFLTGTKKFRISGDRLFIISESIITFFLLSLLLDNPLN